MAHPRGTRNRPLQVLQQSGYQLFNNNINSPGFLRKSLFQVQSQSDSVWVDAISCHKVPNTLWILQLNGRERIFHCFLVQFWHEKMATMEPIVSLEVRTPSLWTPVIFLDTFERNLQKHDIISLLNSYYINSDPVTFNTINTMHHEF
jgi:hypothetical protein